MDVSVTRFFQILAIQFIPEFFVDWYIFVLLRRIGVDTIKCARESFLNLRPLICKCVVGVAPWTIMILSALRRTS